MAITIKKYLLPLLAVVLLLGGSGYSYFNRGIVYSLFTQDLGSIADYVNSFGKLSAVIFFFLVVLEVVVAPIPPFVLYVAGGLIFGTFFGGTLVLISNVVGAIIAFVVARRYGRELVDKKIAPRARSSFNRFFRKYGALSIFLLRVNPITSSDAFSYLAGLSSMSLKGFALGTALGLAPLVYIQTYIGGGVLKDNPALLFLFMIVSLVYLILFLFSLWYARNRVTVRNQN